MTAVGTQATPGASPPKVYVASPLGFNEAGRYWAAQVLHPALIAAGWEVLDPWAEETGAVDSALAIPPGPERVEALRAVSRTIGERNRR